MIIFSTLECCFTIRFVNRCAYNTLRPQVNAIISIDLKVPFKIFFAIVILEVCKYEI